MALLVVRRPPTKGAEFKKRDATEPPEPQDDTDLTEAGTEMKTVGGRHRNLKPRTKIRVFVFQLYALPQSVFPILS